MCSSVALPSRLFESTAGLGLGLALCVVLGTEFSACCAACCAGRVLLEDSCTAGAGVLCTGAEALEPDEGETLNTVCCNVRAVASAVRLHVNSSSRKVLNL